MRLRAIRQKVTVKPGGAVEIRSLELPEGETVEVIVLLDEQSTKSSKPLTSFIGAGKGSFATPRDSF